MTFAEFLDFFFDNAFFNMPFMEALAAIFIALSIGAGLVGIWNGLRNRRRATSWAAERKAA